MRIAVVSLTLIALHGAAQAVVVEMKRETDVDRSIIRLKDVARVHDAVPEERQVLERIYVALAPPPGEVKTVAVGEVRRRLRAHGVNLATVILEGATATRVQRAPQPAVRRAVPRSALTDLVTRFVAAELGRDGGDVQVTLDEVSSRRLEPLAGRGLRWVVSAASPPVRLGHNALVVVGYEGTERRERLTVSAEVKAYCPVPVAARNISRRKRLTAPDLRLERRLVGDPGAAALAIDDLVGRLADRPIRQGDAIEPGMVVEVPLVRRGDMVSVIARAGPIEVRTVGMALEEGAARQTIKVRNADTREVFAARVAAARTVVMELH